MLDRLLAELKEEGHRVLVYSQMTRMIDILEVRGGRGRRWARGVRQPGVDHALCRLLQDYMQNKRYKYTRLDGSSRISERRDMVEDFQTNSDIFVFLLSTRAGGLGINLTAADTVIFFDSDWNPTVDQQVSWTGRGWWGRGSLWCGFAVQAMDRAHRLGQTRQVTVYRLVVKGTIEERILQRAKEKSEVGREGREGRCGVFASNQIAHGLLCHCVQIHRMVIQGGEFRTEGSLKPKEVVSLLLDDAEVETRCE